MKASKDQVKEAILFFARLYGQEGAYHAMMNESQALPEHAHRIVYEMFLRKFNSYYSTDEQYEQYKLLYEYADELNKLGYVKFEDDLGK